VVTGVPRSLVAALLASMLAPLAACGGSDESEIKQTVRDFIKATRDRDADKWCGKLVTHEFLEQATGATGSKATDACRKQIRAAKPPDVRLLKLDKPKVEDDTASVIATIEEQDRPRPQVFRLKNEDGDWRLTSAGVG
jgi:hypothetical protein